MYIVFKFRENNHKASQVESGLPLPVICHDYELCECPIAIEKLPVDIKVGDRSVSDEDGEFFYYIDANSDNLETINAVLAEFNKEYQSKIDQNTTLQGHSAVVFMGELLKKHKSTLATIKNTCHQVASNKYVLFAGAATVLAVGAVAVYKLTRSSDD